MRWSILALFFILSQPLVAKEPQLTCKREIGARTWQGMVFHRYRLKAENFPPEQTFRLIVKSFDGTHTETFKYSANKRGHLILQPPEDFEGDIYAICPAKRGERLTFSMQSVEGEDSYEAELIPFPLEMKSKKGIRLSLELQGEKGDKFLLFAQGFNPAEEVAMFLEVEDKRRKEEAQVTRLGDLCAQIYLPSSGVGGHAKLIVQRKNEEIVFPFEWGEPALKLVGACCFEIK